jgi:Tfp pilus assembly protein PilV
MPLGTEYANREIGMTHTTRNHMRLRARSRLEQAGFTLAEAVVSVAVSMIGLGGVMMMNAQQLKLVSSTRESNAASWALQDRLEQLRNVSWDDLTNAEQLKTALANVPDCARMLPNYAERITLVKSTEAGTEGASKLVIERSANGEAKTISSGSGISTGVEVKVDVVVSWSGKGGRSRERSYTSIISDSGISRTNIPGFGGPTGTTPVENGGSSGSGSSEVPTEQPTEIPDSNGNNGSGGNGNGIGNGNSGNGNPHGNTNGNPGKK